MLIIGAAKWFKRPEPPQKPEVPKPDRDFPFAAAGGIGMLIQSMEAQAKAASMLDEINAQTQRMAFEREKEATDWQYKQICAEFERQQEIHRRAKKCKRKRPAP